jgi:hypothetical protein
LNCSQTSAMPSGVHFFAVSIIVVVIAILRDERAVACATGLFYCENPFSFFNAC